MAKRNLMAKNALLFCAIVLIVLPCCGIALASHGAEPQAEAEGGGAGLFSGTLGDSLWTVVAFVVLVVVLSKVAWKPLLNALIARQSHIEHQLRTAEDSRLRAEKMLEDYKQQGLGVIRQAAEQAQRHQQEMAEKTRQEVLAIRRRAQEEIESARLAAMEDLWKQAGDIVLRVGSEVLGRTLTGKDNEHLVNEAVNKIRQAGGSQ
jgi:F-type H+-transporting ATPase subunit b